MHTMKREQMYSIIYKYIHMYIYTYIRIYVWMDGWMYACMYVCMYVCIILWEGLENGHRPLGIRVLSRRVGVCKQAHNHTRQRRPQFAHASRR